MNKSIIYLYHFIFLILSLFAIFFYQERVCYTDPGLQLFEMINKEGFKVFVHRYSMIINQIFPLIAIKLGLGLKYVMIIYSLSYVFVYYICFLLSYYVFKNNTAAATISLSVLVVRLAFGHSISEGWLAFCYSALFYAMIEYVVQNPTAKVLKNLVYLIFLIIIIIVNYFIHPISLFTLGFALVFSFLKNNQKKNLYYYLSLLIIGCIFGYKFIAGGESHEVGFFDGLKKAPELLPHVFGLPLFKYILKTFLLIYLIPLLLIGIAVFKTIKAKSKLLSLFLILYPIVFVLICAMSFYIGEANYASESRLLPIGFFALIPFFELIKLNEKALFGFISTISLFSFISIWIYTNKYHTPRVDFYKKSLEISKKYSGRKFYTEEISLPKAIPSWGGSQATLFLSSLDGPSNSKTIYYVSKNEIPLEIDAISNPDKCIFLFVNWWQYTDPNKFNKKYFDLDCNPYTYIQIK